MFQCDSKCTDTTLKNSELTIGNIINGQVPFSKLISELCLSTIDTPCTAATRDSRCAIAVVARGGNGKGEREGPNRERRGTWQSAVHSHASYSERRGKSERKKERGGGKLLAWQDGSIQGVSFGRGPGLG